MQGPGPLGHPLALSLSPRAERGRSAGGRKEEECARREREAPNFTTQQGERTARWGSQVLTMSVIIAAQLKMDTGAASRRVRGPPSLHVWQECVCVCVCSWVSLLSPGCR